jgi:hypothetical protein
MGVASGNLVDTCTSDTCTSDICTPVSSVWVVSLSQLPSTPDRRTADNSSSFFISPKLYGYSIAIMCTNSFIVNSRHWLLCSFKDKQFPPSFLRLHQIGSIKKFIELK